MNSNALFALAASVLGAVFALLVGRQYLHRRKPHQLLWTVSMLMFAVASFAQFYAEVQGGWTLGLYRAYYLTAVSLVAVMGGGTVYLLRQSPVGHGFVGLTLLLSFAFFNEEITALAPMGPAMYWPLMLAVSLGLPFLLYRLGLRTAGHTFLALVLILEAAFIVQLWVQPLDTTLFTQVARAAAGKGVAGDVVRHFAAVLNIAGAAALFLGAFYSWWVTRHAYTLILALGTAIFSAGGGLAATGYPFLLHLSEMVGGAVLLYGFVKSQEVGSPRPVSAPYGITSR
ncbi:MAG: hypothetical protein ACM3ZA_03920 [Bacillota bacterium]